MPHQCTECGRTFDDGSKQMLSGCPDCGGNKFQFQPSSAKSEARKAAAEADAAESASADTTDDAPEPSDDRSRADVEREMPELAQDADTEEVEAESPSTATGSTDSPPAEGADQFDDGDDAEIDNTTAEEDRAQRDARSSPTTNEEIDEARRKMAAAEKERLAEVDDDGSAGGTRGRGTPQGPPTDGPDEAAAEEFGLDGAVGGPDEQPSPNAANERGSEADAVEGPETDLSALREELNDQFESIKITAPGQYELNLMELYDRKEYIISLQEDGRYVVDIPEGHEYRED